MAPAPLTPAEQAFYPSLFAKLQQNNLISGQAAYAFLTLSALPPAQLGEIWAVADPNDRGSLDVAGWTVAMRLIASVQNGGAITAEAGEKAPAQLPRFQGHPPPPVPKSSFSAPSPTVAAPRSPFGSAFAPAPQQQAQVPWDVSPTEKQASDRFFDQLDKFGRGVIEGDVAVPFMLESKLPEAILANVWDLADIRKEGNLTRDEFAVAMHLIKKKIAGKELPAELPLSLIPPGLRPAQPAAPGPAAPQQSLFDAFSESPPATASAATNYFASSPVGLTGASAASGFGMAPFAPAPESNLMGDEDDPFVPSNSVRFPQPSISTPVLSPQPTGSFNNAAAAASRTLSPQPTGGSGYRAPPPPPASRSPLPLAHPSAIPSPSPTSPASVPPQLTALRTEHATLSKSVSDLQTQGVSLEPQTIDAGKEIMDLQAKLISLRSTFESERGNVDKLQTRATEQASEKAKVQSDVISAESELSALRVEKDELDGQVMRDREDIRGMKRRMGELTDETAKLKEAVEKVKKEARQQQGLVTITKKQLATSEAARETTRRELAEAEQEVVKAQREAEEAKLAVEKSEREHAEEKSRSAGPASPSSTLAAIPAAIASVVPAAIVPSALSGEESHEEPKEIQETPSVPVDSFTTAATTPAVEEPGITNKEGEEHSTVAEMATGAVAAVVAGAGAVVADATDIFSGDDADKDEPAETHPAETAAQEDPIAAPVVSATTLDEADDDDDSSDDGNEGPEDLDAQPSYSARKELGTDDTSTIGGESLSRQASSHLASTASAFGSFESTAPASDPFESAEEPAVAAAGVPLPISPAVEEPHALNAPFPPGPVDSDRQPTTTAFDDSFGDSTADFNTFDTDFQPVPIASAASTTANNPFFASAPPAAEPQEKAFDEPSPFEPTPLTPAAAPSTPQPPAAPPVPSAPAAAFSAPPPIPSRPDQTQPQSAHAAFDDAFGNDDFETFDADFEPVPVAKSPVGGAASSNNPFSAGAGEGAAKPVYDFDPSFADFDTAFDDARPAHGQTGQSAAAPTDFDDAFGSTPFAPTTSAPDQSASSVGQHAFDDAFGESEPAFGGAQEQNQYAPPAGPPPGQQPQADRPSLPSRPTNTAAEPDDIPDVKKIVAMGFSRSQALNALEIGDYNLQKAIDHLVSGA